MWCKLLEAKYQHGGKMDESTDVVVLAKPIKKKHERNDIRYFLLEEFKDIYQEALNNKQKNTR